MYQQRNIGKRKFDRKHNRPPDRFISPMIFKPLPTDVVYTEDFVPVRKLYFSVPTADIIKKVLWKYFAEFGPIDTFTLHLKLNYCYGFIQYQHLNSAAHALQYKHHSVRGFRIKVSAADSWHQPTTTYDPKVYLRDNPENSVPKNQLLQFLDFNDDCLIEILDKLNCIDLSAAAQTCTRLHEIATEIFRRKYTAINLSSMAKVPDYTNIQDHRLTLFQMRILLKGYGSHIQKLRVAAMSFLHENLLRVLELITRNCISLRTLHLTGFFIKQSLYQYSRSFFANLEELSFGLCEMNDSIKQIFIRCKELRKLTIQSDSNLTGSCLAINFPRLESISLVMNSDIETRHLFQFFKLNPQLKSLKIIHCGGWIYDEFFPRIAAHLPMLESLTIEVDYFQNFAENVMSLLRLEHLRELELNCGMYTIAPFIDALAAKGKIEKLHLSGGLLNDSLIEAISKCKKLTSLKLCSMPSVRNRFLAELAENLPELNDFHILKCQTLDATGIVQFVNIAAKLQTLHIINSSVNVDDLFFKSLVTIYKQRNHRLTLSISNMAINLTQEILNEYKHYIDVVQSDNVFLYDIFGDNFSDTDSDSDINDYVKYDFSEDDLWDDSDSYDDPFYIQHFVF